MKYQNEYLREISFPLGGIGTGSIGMGGNGRLLDWEIFNRPNKGSINGFSHMAIRVKTPDGQASARVLNGDLDKDLVGQYSKTTFGGYGYGPSSKTMCAFPHFSKCVFDGEFPFAKISLDDDNSLVSAVMTAFNPLIPSDEDNSSIPAAFFEVEIRNKSDMDLDIAAVFSVQNPFESSENQIYKTKDISSIHMKNAGASEDDPAYGDLTIASTDKNAFLQSYWYRGGWQDGIATFWREITSSEGFKKREYEKPGNYDMCTLASEAKVKAGGKKTFRFVLSWNIPNNYNYWIPLKDESGKDITWKNYYAKIFENSIKSAEYSLKNWDSLYRRTMNFKDSFFSQSLDESVIDAASANLSVLKSATVLRLEDGSFYGWEGMHEQEGSCEGTCQHVWNYAYALCFLFPKLERSIRDLEFKYNVFPSGETNFRLKLPLGRDFDKFRACVDGQFGCVIKSYREWKISGDDDWLRGNWQQIKKVLEYAWSDENKDEWDKNKDGVLEGRQHHTLDMELFGPSSWLEGFYLAALKAAAEMAEYLGESEKAKEYMDLFDRGYTWTKENLFNGSYFIQKIDLGDESVIRHYEDVDGYWNEEAKEIKYQIGEGSEIDQMCAQWHSNILGLGNIYDGEQKRTALENMYKNNFKSSLREFTNPWRVFGLNDEAGAVICDYPEGVYKPVIPIPYCEETMHGFEYQLAGLLISEGKIEEGLSIVKGVRDRYDGRKRNPWNEFECGSNYARSMASFALIPVFSGFKFDLPHKMIGFVPIEDKDEFKFFWALDSVWGTVEGERGKIKIKLEEGKISLDKLYIKNAEEAEKLVIDGEECKFLLTGGKLCFDEKLITDSIEILRS